MPSTDSAVGQQRKGCRSCGIIGGIGLMAAGGYIYFHARKFVSPGYIPFFTAVQMFFAMGLHRSVWSAVDSLWWSFLKRTARSSVTTFGVVTFSKSALGPIDSSNPTDKSK